MLPGLAALFVVPYELDPGVRSHTFRLVSSLGHAVFVALPQRFYRGGRSSVSFSMEW
jgi:hypothetical protein